MEKELPKGWEIKELGRVYSEVKQRVIPTKGSSLKYIGLEHLNSGGGIEKIGEADDLKSQKTAFKKGDVLYGKLRPYLNKHAIVDFDGICSTDILAYRAPNENLAKWLNHYLGTQKFIEFANSSSKGINLPRISPKEIAEYPIPIPPIPEQHRIVAKLDAVLAKVDSARGHMERLPGILQRFRQSVLAQAVSGKLTEGWRKENAGVESAEELINRLIEFRKDDYEKQVKIAISNKTSKPRQPRFLKSNYKIEEEYGIPVTWKWEVVDRLFEVAIGATPSRNVSAYWDGQIPWVSSGEVANNEIYETEENITKEGVNNSSVKVYPAGTVLIAMIGEGKTRGQTSLLRIDAGSNQNVAALLINQTFIDSQFVWYSFLARYEKTRGGGRGGNQPALNGIKVGEMSIPIPPLAEQQEIVRRVQSLFAVADRLEARYEALREKVEGLPQALLAKAFRGELVPQNPLDEPITILLEKLEQAKSTKEENSKKDLSKSYLPKLKTIRMKDTQDKTIEEVLQSHKGNPMKASDVWKQSKFSGSIDEFYEELRLLVEIEKKIEAFIDYDKESYLKLVKQS